MHVCHEIDCYFFIFSVDFSNCMGEVADVHHFLTDQKTSNNR